MVPTGALTVHGARGSIPVSGSTTARYGGRTTCFALDAVAGEQVIFDCGTGLALADGLRPAAPTRFHVFLSHYHLDHLMGLPLFGPLFEERHRFVFYGRPPEDSTLEAAVAAPFSGVMFPVAFRDTASEKSFVALDRDPVEIGALRVTPIPLRHPQGVTGFRLDRGAASVVIATDHEAGDTAIDRSLAELAGGTDTLIHDAQYTPDEYRTRYGGWGHSTWQHAVAAATAAGVRRLVLTSHDPFRSDDAVDAIVEQASQHFPDVAAACEGMIIPLGEDTPATSP